MKRSLLPALALLLPIMSTAACVRDSAISLPRNEPVQAQRFAPNVQQNENLGTAQDLFPRAKQIASHWNARSQFVQLDGYWITEKGRNDFTLEGLWCYYFAVPGKPDFALKVNFASRYAEPVVSEVPRQTIRANVEIPNWSVDSDLLMQLALANGIYYYPVDQARLSYSVRYRKFVWQVVSHGDYLAVDAMTGEPLTPVAANLRKQDGFFAL